MGAATIEATAVDTWHGEQGIVTEVTGARTDTDSSDPAQVQTVAQFAAGLTDLRLRAGRSIRDVARATGIPSATLGGYFSGRHLPPSTQPHLLDVILPELGVADPARIDQWREALLRVRRSGAGRAAGAAPASASPGAPSPYRGLESFTEEDAALFFGREAVVDSLVDAVLQRGTDPAAGRLLVVVGPSGSGKSSVLRAGLVPRMRGHAPDTWAVAVMVPGSEPLAALEPALSELATADHALLVVDQAEELFSPEVDAQERREFLAELARRAAPNGPLVVVAGLRADFYGEAANEPEVLPALRTGQLVLGAMSIDELRQAVVRPAQAVGVEVDDDLVQLLLRDLTPRGHAAGSYDAGALPLVSHALLSTWQQHTGTRLTVADYLAVGGLAGAVQQTAEQVFAGLDEPGRSAAQWLFTQLVFVDDDAAMVRRRVEHDDLRHPDPTTDLALDPVIEAFISGRLLTAGDGTLQISHEALLTAWPRLHDWVLTDLDSARQQRRIGEAATAWRAGDRDPALLLRGGPLATAETLAARPATSPRTLTAAEQEFVAASGAQQAQEHAAEHRRTRRLHALVAVLTALTLLAGLLAVTAIRARNDAQTQERLAAAARDEATSRQLAIAADTLRDSDPALAGQLSLAAYRTSPTLQARSSLLDTTGTMTPTRIVGPIGEMVAVSNPDGTLLAISSSDGVTRLWQRADQSAAFPAQPTGKLDPIGDPTGIYAAAFSPDGRLLALGLSDGRLVLWDVSDPSVPRTLATPTTAGPIHALAFSADGRQLAAGTAEPGVQRWRVAAADSVVLTELPAITDVDGMVNSLDYSPKGDVLATGTSDGTVRLWRSPDSGSARLLDEARVGEPTNFVFSVAFDKDGHRLATGEKNRAVRLWDVTDPGAMTQVGKPLADFESWVNSVAFSPDGTQLAAGSSDGSVRIYDTADPTRSADLPNPTSVTGVQYVGDGRQLLTAEVDGVARLWPLPGPVRGGFGDTIWNVLTSTDDSVRLVAPGAVAGQLHLFDTSTQPTTEELLTPPESAGRADGAAGMAADGTWMAAGTATGNVAVWHRPTADGPARLMGVVSAGDQLIESVTIGAHDLMAAISDDNAVVVWRLDAAAAPAEVHRLAAAHLPLGVALSPDGSILAVSTSGGEVQLWRIADADGTPLAQAQALPTLTGFDNYVYAVAFDPSGRYLAAGSTDRTIRIWDVSDPAAAVAVGAPLRGARDTVFQLAWSADSSLLAAATKDGSVWLWDVADPSDPAVRATLSPGAGNFYAVMLSPDQTHVSGAGSAASVVTWQTDPTEVAGEICAMTGTGMSAAEWEQSAPGVAYQPPCPTS